MFRHAKNLANPFHRAGAYIGPHAVLIAVLLIAAYVSGFGSGWYARSQFNGAYFRAHYPFPGLKQPTPGVGVPVQDIKPKGAPSAASIQVSRYPAVGNQGSLGACAAWASAWAASFEYRVLHNDWIRFSPRYEYDHYSDTYNNGQDGGSWPDQDLETLGTTGIPQFKQLPEPPFLIDNPIPYYDAYGASLAVDAAKRITPFQMHYISGFAQGAGQGAVDGVRAAIVAGHPVLIALPVYPEYDNATQQPLIVSPQPGEVSRGGHENVVLAYDDTKVFPDGSIGGVEVQNQWTKQWGSAGRAWLSYDFVRRYSFGLEYLTLGAQSTHAARQAHRFVPNHAPKYNIVPKGWTLPPTAAGSSAWRVKNVYTRDTHVDLTAAFNYWGTKYGVWPVGMVAVAATESGIRQYADRWGVWPDVSFGLSQFTVATANGYGVPGDAYAVRAYLDNPFNSIELMARYLHDAQQATCLGFPQIYAAYNMGSGYGCGAYIYYHPQGQASTNYYGNWLPNFNYVVATYSDYGPPPPPPTPKPRIVCGKRISLRHVKDGHGGYYFGHFWYCNKLTWPRFGWKQKTIVTWRKR